MGYGNKNSNPIIKDVEVTEDVPIVIRLDSGFFDQKLFRVFESLQIGYICGGKLYDDIKALFPTVMNWSIGL